MRKHLMRAILVSGTVAGALCLAVPAAMAAGTVTVSGGTNFTSVQASGTTFVLNDTTAGSGFTCTVATGSGTVMDGTFNVPAAIGTVATATFGSSGTPCKGTGGAAGQSGTSKQSGTATLNVTAPPSGGVTTGTVTNADEVLTAAGGLCTITVKGTAGVSYTNGTSSGLLKFTTAGDNLKVTSVSGICPGVHTNDVVTFSSGSGGETVTGSPVNPITLS